MKNLFYLKRFYYNNVRNYFFHFNYMLIYINNVEIMSHILEKYYII